MGAVRDTASPQVEGEGGEGGEAQHHEADAVLPACHCAETQRQRHSHLTTRLQCQRCFSHRDANSRMLLDDGGGYGQQQLALGPAPATRLRA